MSYKNFTITSTDGTYTYTNPKNMSVIQEPENNNIKSNTQGFLRKIQVGAERIKATVSIIDDRSNVEANLLPQLTYPSSVSVTIDRNWYKKSTATAIFVIENIQLTRELSESGDAEYRILLTELIAV